jgi:flavorubredoxin
MEGRIIREGVHLLGAVDWDRRLFDSLIPLPHGTSYNAYLVAGRERTVLLDTADPATSPVLLEQLARVPRIDDVVIQHVEQDHSGTLPLVLERYPGAVVRCSPKARGMIVDHLGVAADRILPVADGETLDLGGRSLTFLHTPWVHWPETICSWLAEERILFSCDFFGSHLATSSLFVEEEGCHLEHAKRYYAEIMSPFRGVIRSNLEKLASLPVEVIAPSHGPLYRRPAFIMDLYREWSSETPRNLALVLYVTMHGSTGIMAQRLTAALTAQGVGVRQFNLADSDLGEIAMGLVDAATVVIGSPAVLVGPHPAAAAAAFVANALRPKTRFVSVFGSYGWGAKVAETLAAALPNLKAEVLEGVICRGSPSAADLEGIDRLAGEVARRHRDLGLF